MRKKTPLSLTHFGFLLQIAIVIFKYGTASASIQTTLYVSTKGNDANSGTFASPYLTLNKALDKVATLKAAMRGDIIVAVRGGTYWLDSAITITAAHGGLDPTRKVIIQPYKNEVAVFSGGKTIADHSSKWQFLGDNKYKLRIPCSPYFRHLYVDGRRAPRSTTRSSDNALSRGSETTYSFCKTNKQVRNNCNAPYISSANFTEATLFDDNTLIVPGKANWATRGIDSNENIEAVFISNHRCHRTSVSSITSIEGNAIISFPPKGFIAALHALYNLAPTSNYFDCDRFTFFLENALQFLNSDGEWYYDGKEALYYCSKKSPDKACFVRGNGINTLLRIEGSESKKVSNIVIRGLTFSNTDWKFGNSEINPDFANGIGYLCNHVLPLEPVRGLYDFKTSMIPAAIDVKFATEITFENNILCNLGADGLCVKRGCSNLKITGNTFRDISGNALFLGEVDENIIDSLQSIELIPSNIFVCNNRIIRAGFEYYSCVGIFLSFAKNVSICFNTISDVGGPGIWIGWVIPEHYTPNSKQIDIHHNRIINCVNKVVDQGGINVFRPTDPSKDTDMYYVRIDSNYIEMQKNAFELTYGNDKNDRKWYSRPGIYIDEQTRRIRAMSNVIQGASDYAIKIHNVSNNNDTIGDVYYQKKDKSCEAVCSYCGSSPIPRTGKDIPFLSIKDSTEQWLYMLSGIFTKNTPNLTPNNALSMKLGMIRQNWTRPRKKKIPISQPKVFPEPG
jgi:hypothetical protein